MDYSLYDDGWGKFWSNPENFKDPRQTEIKFFWPLTEQIELGLDTPEQPKSTLTYPTGSVISGFDGTGLSWVTTASNIESVQLSVRSGENVGSLEIGKMEVGLDIAPKWYQRVLYKLLGFNWKDK